MSQKYKILIVEDEESIRIGLCDLFVYHGYQVEWADDGQKAWEMAQKSAHDLIILDVMLPSLDGFTLCQKIKERKRDQVIIMLTAKGGEDDVIMGLSLGADDYISKPFSVRELVLRVETILRRSGRILKKGAKLRIGNDLIIDLQLMEGISNASKSKPESIVFTRREIDILLFLLQNEDRHVSRDELLSQVWGYEKAASIETRTVDIHIAKLRRKIEPDVKNPSFLITARGEGYRLVSARVSDE